MEKKYSPQGQYSPSQSLLNQLLAKQHHSQEYQIQHQIQSSHLDKQHLNPSPHLNVRINSPQHSNAKSTVGPLQQNDSLVPAYELNQRSNFQKFEHDISKEKIISSSSSQTVFPLQQQINSSFTAPKNSPPKYSNKFNSSQPLSLAKNNYLNPSAGNINTSQPNLAGASSSHNTPALGLISQQQHLAAWREQQMLNHSNSITAASAQNKISPKTNQPSLDLGNGDNNVHYWNPNKDFKNELSLPKAPILNSPSQQLPSALDKKTHLLNLEKIRNNLNNKLLLKASIEDPKSSSLHFNCMKVKPITPQSTSKPQMFECSKKSTSQQPAQENVSLSYGQGVDKHRRSPPNKPKPLEIGSELDERSSCNGGNSLTFDETQKNGHVLEEVSKRSYYQVEQNPKVKLMMFDKLKKRKKKNSSSAKGNDNTKYKQNGHSFNISYSKSSQPSNVSTRAQQQISKSTTNKGISESRVTPQSTSANGINGQVTQFFASPNNLANLQKAAAQFATSKHQLSKTLSFTFKQGNPLLNSDPITPQQAVGQENMAKIIHSPSAVIYVPPQAPIVETKGANNSQSIKHRKVVSMSSSSPKYTKEAMQQNCQLVGSNLSIDFKKLLSAQTRSVLPNNKSKKANNNNTNSDIKNCYASSPLVFHKDAEKLNKAPVLFAGNSQCFGIKKVADIEGSKIQGGLQSANSSQNLQDASMLEGAYPQTISTNEKSKTFLSKITGNAPNMKSGIDNRKDFTKNQKNQSLMVVTNHLVKQEKSAQIRIGGGAAVEPSAIFKSQGDLAVSNMKQQKFQEIEGSNPQNFSNNHATNATGALISQISKPPQSQNVPKSEGSGLTMEEQVNKILKEKIKFQEENQIINAQFDLILKSRIDEGSYSGIMEAFGKLASSDTYFQSSLQKFKVCLDSFLHCINSKIKQAHLESQQPVSMDDTPDNEGGKKKSNSAVSSLNNTNQSKSPFMKGGAIPQNQQQFLLFGNINETNGQHLNNSSFSVIQNNNYPSQQQTPLSFASTSKSPNITKLDQRRKEDNNCPKQIIFSSKQTQTEGLNGNIQISKSEEDVTKENAALREFVVEQEGKLAAYKAKEASMIKLLLAVKDRGINIDEIYENDVISQNQQVSKPTQNNKQIDDEDEECDDESVQPDKIQGHSKFLDDMAKGILHHHNDLSQSQGFADESIVNDSDESSFNYYGKAQSDDEDSINSSGNHQLHHEQQQHSNMNSGRSKFEDDMKLKLRLDLSDLKKVNTQLNDEIVPPNNNNIPEQVQKNTNPQFLNNGNSLSATDNNKNIFIEQAYIDSNPENNHSPPKKQPNIVKGHILDHQALKVHKNSQKYQQEQQPQERTTPMQEYLIHPQTKLSQEEIAEYISKSDFEAHQIDQHFQNNFDFEEEEQQENNILLGCDGLVPQDKTKHTLQRQVDKAHLNGQQFELVDKLGDISQTWPDENKRLSF